MSKQVPAAPLRIQSETHTICSDDQTRTAASAITAELWNVESFEFKKIKKKIRVVQEWLCEASCSCVYLPACAFGMDIAKSWLFATSLEALQLGGKCTYPQYSMHASIPGTKDESGAYLSADIVASMISGPGSCLIMGDAMSMIPTKPMSDHLEAFQDGGDLFSFPD